MFNLSYQNGKIIAEDRTLKPMSLQETTLALNELQLSLMVESPSDWAATVKKTIDKVIEYIRRFFRMITDRIRKYTNEKTLFIKAHKGEIYQYKNAGRVFHVRQNLSRPKVKISATGISIDIMKIIHSPQWLTGDPKTAYVSIILEEALGYKGDPTVDGLSTFIYGSKNDIEDHDINRMDYLATFFDLDKTLQSINGWKDKLIIMLSKAADDAKKAGAHEKVQNLAQIAEYCVTAIHLIGAAMIGAHNELYSVLHAMTNQG